MIAMSTCVSEDVQETATHSSPLEQSSSMVAENLAHRDATRPVLTPASRASDLSVRSHTAFCMREGLDVILEIGLQSVLGIDHRVGSLTASRENTTQARLRWRELGFGGGDRFSAPRTAARVRPLQGVSTEVAAFMTLCGAPRRRCIA
jgi:hypothetical protein